MAESTGWWVPLVEAGGALLSSVIANKGADDAADAERAGQERAIQLYRDIYQDQRGLTLPNYMTGGAAMNKLASMYNIAPQDYAKAAAGGGVSAGGSSGGGYLPNFGAGQPVAGHSGGGGSNALTGALGSAAGSFFGGPIGGAIGGALGGLIRNGGDNWKTIATQAPGGYDYDAYFAADPGLASEWAKPDVRSLFGGNRDAYLYWHSQGGQMNGKQSWAPGQLAPLASGNTQSTQPVGTPQLEGQSGQNALSSGFDMNEFWNSPEGKLATENFLGVGIPEVQGAYAAGGKSVSGATTKALYDRGKATAQPAFGNYKAGLQSLAGLNPTSAASINTASGAYGANAGQGYLDIGKIMGNKSQQLNNNWMKFGQNALSGYV